MADIEEHPNVVNLVGACSRAGTWTSLFERIKKSYHVEATWLSR